MYPGVWSGIDVAYSGTADQLKQEFVLEPGADPGQIRLAYRGADVSLGEGGELLVATPVASFTDSAPVAYQLVNGQRMDVLVEFVLSEASGEGAQAVTEYGFSVGAYDTTLPLVIDPAVLIYSGFIGGGSEDMAFDIAVDSSGCAYVTGSTSSGQASFPESVGPDLSYNDSGFSYGDAFVAKVEADGTGLVYCGYIGGADYDLGYDIAVDSSDCAYITGFAWSDESTFPVVVGPDLTYNDGGDTGEFHTGDAFVAKVSADGTSLEYCGYIGGSRAESGYGITVDSSDCAYITGRTTSSEATFPVAVGPDLTYTSTYAITWDSFLAKVSADGTSLAYCGYIGGTGDDWGNDVAVDGAGRAYVTGYSTSTQSTFPVTGGPDLTFNGGVDAYVAKVGATGASLTYCGYLGGASADEGKGIAVDAAGNAYLTGYTGSTQSSFPVSVGPDLTHNLGYTDAFVAKLNSTGTAYSYCGYIGGTGMDEGLDIAVDGSGSAYVTGVAWQNSGSFPVREGPDSTYNGSTRDAFVAKVSPGGSYLPYCGYIGGIYDDWGNGIAVDSAGHAYIAGRTYSSEATFPAKVGPDVTHNHGGGYGGDAFVTKVALVDRAQQDDAKLTYLGKWATGWTWAASGGSFYSSDMTGAAILVEFTGTYVDLIARTTPWYGKAEISLDGGLPDTVDFYSAGIVYKQSIYAKTGLVDGPHTLLIECIGDKNPSSSGKAISLDAIDTFGGLTQADTPTRYQEGDTDLEFSGVWDLGTTADASGGYYVSGDSGGVAVSVSFDGTYLAWIARTAPWYGKAKVSLDGGPVETVDLYTSAIKYKQKVWDTGLLTDGTHTVYIYWADDKNASSLGTRISVDAFDVFDTLNSAAPAPPVVWRYQQDDPKITYVGDWVENSTWLTSGGSYHYTDTPNAAIFVDFTGTSVELIGNKAPWYGKMEVTLDGSDTTVDCYSSSQVFKQSLFAQSGLTDGPHYLVIKCLGEGSTNPDGFGISLDAVDVNGPLDQADMRTRYQQNEAFLKYTDTWTSVWTWSSSGGSYAWAGAPAAAANVTFDGTSIAWIATTSSYNGIAKVSLDGGPLETVDLYSSSTKYKQRVWDSGLLDDDPHTLSIYWTGEKRQSAKGTAISVDAFDILGTLTDAPEATPIPLLYQQNDSKISYMGTWSTASDSSASGGSFVSSDHWGSAALAQFTGTTVSIIGRTTPWYGKLEVILDGGTPEVVDMYSATVLYGQAVYTKTGLAAGPHTLTMKCTGYKNTLSAWYTVGLDALEITGVLDDTPKLYRFQESSHVCSYSIDWDSAWTVKASGGRYAYTDAANATLTVNFHGWYMALYVKTAPWYGKFSISVDGGAAVELDQYSPTEEYQKFIFHTGLLANTSHTVVIKRLGTKNDGSIGTGISVDALDIVTTTP